MAQQGYGGQGYAASQLGAASGSGSTTPASGATRSGRVVKPVKPYTAPVQPARGSSTRMMQGGGGRSSAAGGHATAAAVPTGPPPPPQRHPLAVTLSAVPPMTRITGPGNEAKQAMFTTYPARMRLGMSTLMQPNAFAATAAATSNGTPAGGAGGASGTGGANTPVVPGKRQRTTINYADFENLDDLLDGDEDEDHHGNNNAMQQGGRARRGQSSTPAVQSARGKVAATTPAAPPKPEYWGDGKSYLGALPPGNLVQVQPVKTTKHLAL